MKIRRVLALVKKDLRKLTRDPGTLFLLVLFPVILTAVFGLAFGGIGESGPQMFEIGVANLDGSSTNPEWADSFISNLTETEGIIVSQYDDNATGQADLLQGNLDAFIVIPEGLGDSCSSFWSSPNDARVWANSTIGLYVDDGSLIASTAIPPIVNQVILATLFGDSQMSMEIPIQLTNPQLISVSSLSQWDFMVPGMFAFSAIFITVIVAQSITVEKSEGLLDRVVTTPLTSSEYIASLTTSYMAVTLLQAVMIFLTSYVIGYRPSTGPVGFAFALSILGVFSLVCVGLGLITATFSKSADGSTGLSFMVAMPQMFLGTFMPLGGIADAVSSVMPSKYVTDALTTLFLRGAPVTMLSIWIDLALVTVAGFVVVMIGVFVFGKWGINRH
ncbi:MAG: ABC transporter permease [Candidatus Thorarchaeota archaeon]|nr:MAG: ABC transporter permease [Candidatus Thorarchaeota archaeon]